MSRKPSFGHTRQGLPVHARAVDHLPSGNPVQRFNKWLMVKTTSGVGTAWCAYIFALIALSSLRSTLALHSVNADIQWVAQTFLQLVLLAVILAGQNIQAVAGDARNAKQFEDIESVRADLTRALDALDTRTRGGLADVLEAVHALDAKVAAARKIGGGRM